MLVRRQKDYIGFTTEQFPSEVCFAPRLHDTNFLSLINRIVLRVSLSKSLLSDWGVILGLCFRVRLSSRLQLSGDSIQYYYVHFCGVFSHTEDPSFEFSS
jgi:hypothetical protein